MSIPKKPDANNKGNFFGESSFTLGFWVIFCLSILVYETHSLKIFIDSHFFITLLASAGGWGGSTVISALIRKKFPTPGGKWVGLSIFLILVFIVGTQVIITLGHRFGYPDLVSYDIYVLAPGLIFSTLKLVRFIRASTK